MDRLCFCLFLCLLLLLLFGLFFLPVSNHHFRNELSVARRFVAFFRAMRYSVLWFLLRFHGRTETHVVVVVVSINIIILCKEHLCFSRRNVGFVKVYMHYFRLTRGSCFSFDTVQTEVCTFANERPFRSLSLSQSI